jgi:hypothetical protein
MLDYDLPNKSRILLLEPIIRFLFTLIFFGVCFYKAGELFIYVSDISLNIFFSNVIERLNLFNILSFFLGVLTNSILVKEKYSNSNIVILLLINIEYPYLLIFILIFLYFFLFKTSLDRDKEKFFLQI